MGSHMIRRIAKDLASQNVLAPRSLLSFMASQSPFVSSHFLFASFRHLSTKTLSEEQDILKNRHKLLTIAIVGPPNVGKSTLFNRFVDKSINKTYRLAVDRHHQKFRNSRSGRLASNKHGKGAKHASSTAIVSDVPGTTRDRRECIGRLGSIYFRLMDTAGIDGERLDSSLSANHLKEDDLMVQKAMVQQTAQAALEADLILLMFDARVGVTNDLLETARWLRKNRGKRSHDAAVKDSIVVLANKLEGYNWNNEGSIVLDHLTEATRVGFGEPIPISAIHGEGMTDIALVIEEAQRRKNEEMAEDDTDGAEAKADGEMKPLQLAILGRQNVGKSTLVNALLKQERVITGSTPGLTRDAIAVQWSWKGQPVQLVDTAGIRKRSKRDHSSDIEDMAVEDAMRAMKVADVAVLVIDAGARMLQRQELTIASSVLQEGRSLVVAANKMDLIVEEGYSRKQFADAVREQLEARFPFLRQTPIIAMSSLYGYAVDELMPVVFEARGRWARTISTGQLNRWLAEVVLEHPPPSAGNRKVRIKYIMQTKGRPPTFLLFCNTDRLPDSYVRYLTKHFQDTFEMYGMEVRLVVKKSSARNPFASKTTRSGTGLGGREARKIRTIKLLKQTGSPDAPRRS